MKSFDIHNLSVHASGSMTGVFWTASNGERHHVWLAMEQVEGSTCSSPNNGLVPVKPYRVKGEYRLGHSDYAPSILYRNAPLNVDGTHKSRHDAGFFETRRLNATAKANAPLVAEALRRAEAEGLFEAAVEQATRDEIDKQARDLKERADKMRKDLDDRIKLHADRPGVVAIFKAMLRQSDADLVKAANL